MIGTPPGADATLATPPASRFRLGRLGPLFLVGQLGWAIPGAISATLLQALAAEIDPAHKIAIYTTFAIVGAVTSALGTVLGGTLSDRTRSRLGKRSPWLIGSALLATVALVGTGLTHSVLVIGICYALYQAGIGAWVASLSALIPDRVPAGAVGRASAFAGFGYLLGQTVGGVIGGGFVTKPSSGLILAPWTIVIAAILITVFVRGRDNRGEPRASAGRNFLRQLAPPASRDFWFAFAGRFLFILAIVMLSTFQLFTLTDYLHLTTAKAGGVIAEATVIFGVLAAVSVIVAGPLSDRVGRKKPFVIAAPLLVTVGLIPLLVAPSVATYVLFFSITGVAFGAYISVDQALMVAVLPDKESAARDLGFLSIGSTLPSVVAPLVGGVLAQTLGYSAIFTTSLVVSIVGAAVIFGIRSVK
ncbi:MAG: putative sucrose symporter [Microbacteriaceae bacterium]|nr:putative sucrose symporter [Microbacteriaceae bacterium]